MAGFILPIMSGLAGLFGGGQQQQQTTNQTTQQSGQGTSSSSTTPNLSPLQQALASMFTSGASNLYNTATNLQPYTTQGLGQIQGQGTANAQAIQNAVASRGLSYSPAAETAQTQNQLNTGNQQQGFLQQIPLLQRQLQTQGLQQLMGAFGVLPTGVSTNGQTSQSGTSTMNGTNTTTGNPMAGLFGGLGAGLAAPGGSSGMSNLSNILSMFGSSPSSAGFNANLPNGGYGPSPLHP